MMNYQMKIKILSYFLLFICFQFKNFSLRYIMYANSTYVVCSTARVGVCSACVMLFIYLLYDTAAHISACH